MKRLFAAAALTALAAPAFAQDGDLNNTLGRDTDGDGLISREEAQAAQTAAYNRLDADGNGTVSLEEFRTVLMGRFDQVDTNDDDFLSRDELKKARPGNGRVRRGLRQ